VDFTREPIIETVITPKEGCKLVVRSSKTTGQEEYFVDAIEIISFGNSIFYRSLERPKSFIVPASDYEVLEVREARIVLKNVGFDKSIKIAGGREGGVKGGRETAEEVSSKGQEEAPPAPTDGKGEVRLERKRERRRHARRRRGREDEASSQDGQEVQEEERKSTSDKQPHEGEGGTIESPTPLSPAALSSLLAPPPMLISETISNYKERFGEAFYTKEELAKIQSQEEYLPGETVTPEEPETLPEIKLEQPSYSTFEITKEDEEAVAKQKLEEQEKPEATNNLST
jgi:hypothetical protein